MGSTCRSDDEECQFFDACEDTDALSELGVNPLGRNSSISDAGGISIGTSTSSSRFGVWLQNPESVRERRSKFFNWLGLSVNKMPIEDEDLADSSDSDRNVEIISSCSSSGGSGVAFGCEFYSSRSFMACCSSDGPEFSEDSISRENFSCQGGISGGRRECVVDKLAEEVRFTEDQEVCSDSLAVAGHIEHDPRSLNSSRKALQDDCVGGASDLLGPKKGIKKWWLEKLRSFSCVLEGQEDYENSSSVHSGAKVHRVKVRQCKKRSKELSALYLGEDIQAHRGSILTMKFSPDGRYLASAGEDGVVRIWRVVEDARSDELDIPDIDPSCVYFTMNHRSELKPVTLEKEKTGGSKSLKKTSESACVIVPPTVFRIPEVPLHEFRGHTGEVVDLSWSKNNYLLSSSVDKTVRLWQVGCARCIKVFSHNHYVTCVRFSPVDGNYFISGSIDGKVRIWEISGCQVISWTDIKDIVTAVCYRPDGQGVIIGSMTGCCRFYGISGNRLELDAQVCFNSKKKSFCKRITGLQYLPQDPCKVMVTSADARVRILEGTNVFRKYKGLRGAGNCSSASLTADGKHIVSACEDSNVYVWSCNNQHCQDRSQSKKVQSFERFTANASVAIPWCGMHNEAQIGSVNERSHSSYPYTSPASFLYDQELYLESYPKGSATWPEEKLAAAGHLGTKASMHKSEFKFLKSSCQSTSQSHAWGMVIVTAGFDGRIKSFHNYGLPAPS